MPAVIPRAHRPRLGRRQQHEARNRHGYTESRSRDAYRSHHTQLVAVPTHTASSRYALIADELRARPWDAGAVTVFEVWAPRPESVRVQVDGVVHGMTRSPDGWWRARVDAGQGTRYGFLLDDDPTVLPD